MIHFRISKGQDIIEQGMALFDKHWEEVALHQNVRPLNIDYGMYLRLEAQNKLACIGIYDEQKFIGYAIFTITAHHHYKQDKMASNIALFIDPTSRFGRKPFDDLEKFCEDYFKKLGLQVINYHVKPTRDFSPLLKKKGYEIEDTIYSKRLD